MADGIAQRFDNRAYTAAEERQLAAVLAQPSTSLLPRPGRRPGGGLEVTVGGTPEAAHVAPGGGIMVDTSRGGGFIFVVPATVDIDLDARPSGGTSRKDIVFAVIKNQDIIAGDATREVDVQVSTGTPSAGTPTAPSVPAGGLLLGELTVPASGTVSVAKAPQRIASLGGILPVASSTERDAIEVIYDGLLVYREDTDVLQLRANGAWVTLHMGDTGWTAISAFATGYSADGSKPPKVRTIRGNEVKIKGRINGTFGANSVIQVLNAGAVPSPPEQIERQITGNSAASSCRAYIATDGSVTVVTGASAPTYVHIDGLSGYMID